MTVVLLAAAALCAGCGSFSLAKAEADQTILTGAVPANPDLVRDPQKESDQVTIRNAVSSANIEELSGGSIPWANVDTDSRGAIFDIVDVRARGTTCRRFRASRESFSGVSLFSGETCLEGNGFWRLKSFREG